MSADARPPGGAVPLNDETVIVPPPGGAAASARPGGAGGPQAPGDETVIVPPPQAQPEPLGDETVIVSAAALAARGLAPPPVAAPAQSDDDATRLQPPADAPDALGLTRPAHPATGAGSGAHPPSSHTFTNLPSGTASGAAAEPDPALVRQVGRYQVQSRLGRGGMAAVYRAHDPSIGRDVAIKFLHASLAEDQECRARFLREARAAGGLSHAAIVVVHDVGEIGSRPYMAMELIDGPTLAERLDKERQLPLRAAVQIGIQLAQALDYAHARGIVHRDIKPGNIMLPRNGQSVKVADFGIAHMDDGGHDRTLVGAVIGTPQYMSPEQTRGDKIDGRSDIFSAGVVLYQMVTGERPFKGDSLVAVASKIATEQPPPVTQARPDAPPALRRVIERCLAKPPAQRYQNGEDLAAALSAVLAEMDERGARAQRQRIVPLRVRWALAMAAVVAVVMGLAASVISQRQYDALMGQASSYGTSMARFIARQHADSAVRGEWDVIDVAVQEMMRSGNFERIVVIDRQGVVRASSIAGQKDKSYAPPGTELLAQAQAGTQVLRYQAAGESVLGFEAPILFKVPGGDGDARFGKVALGIPEQPLAEVARVSILLMVALVAITVLAVALAMYVLGNRFAKPIRLVRHSMGEIARGGFSLRIAERRKDEFGLLYQAFDDMAGALQEREARHALALHAQGSPADAQSAAPQAAPHEATAAGAGVDAAASGADVDAESGQRAAGGAAPPPKDAAP